MKEDSPGNSMYTTEDKVKQINELDKKDKNENIENDLFSKNFIN